MDHNLFEDFKHNQVVLTSASVGELISFSKNNPVCSLMWDYIDIDDTNAQYHSLQTALSAIHCLVATVSHL